MKDDFKNVLRRVLPCQIYINKNEKRSEGTEYYKINIKVDIISDHSSSHL